MSGLIISVSLPAVQGQRCSSWISIECSIDRAWCTESSALHSLHTQADVDNASVTL